jgi:hypothetical protein
MKFGWDNCVLIQVVFQNSTFAGGVVIGTSADMIINIWEAMIIGGSAGAGVRLF